MPRLKFGVELPQHLTYQYIRDMALKSEELGYDSVWIRDHVNILPTDRTTYYIDSDGSAKISGRYLSCMPTLAALAAETRKVTVGTNIFNLPRRHPVDVANEVAAIDEISGGRVILCAGVGAHDSNQKVFDIPPVKERGQIMEEQIQIMKMLWTHDEPISFKGRYFTIENGRLGHRPVQKPHPPLWLGISKTFRRAGRYADGFNLTATMFGGSINDFRRGVQRVREEAKKAGRDPDDIEAMARFCVAIGHDEGKAKRRMVDYMVKFRGAEQPWMTEWSGPPEKISKLIQPYIDAGATHVVLWPIPYSSAPECYEDMTLFIEDVVPRLRS